MGRSGAGTCLSDSPRCSEELLWVGDLGSRQLLSLESEGQNKALGQRAEPQQHLPRVTLVSDPAPLTRLLLLLLLSGSRSGTRLDCFWSGTSLPSWIKGSQLMVWRCPPTPPPTWRQSYQP